MGVDSIGDEQLSLFVNQEQKAKQRKIENAINIIKSEMWLNSVLRGIDLEDGATAITRNNLIGGHNAK